MHLSCVLDAEDRGRPRKGQSPQYGKAGIPAEGPEVREVFLSSEKAKNKDPKAGAQVLSLVSI